MLTARAVVALRRQLLIAITLTLDLHISTLTSLLTPVHGARARATRKTPSRCVSSSSSP